jgi:hypothetical protein
MPRRIFSERVDLVLKSREIALAAVQIYNNPLTTFKTEAFIVLFIIAWTYIFHAYYRSKGIDYRYYSIAKKRKKFVRNPDGSIRHWDLTECISKPECPIDTNTSNNLKFLIGLRNQIEHRKASGLDSYLSARYQACALNFNHYLKELFGQRYSLDRNLALSLQFAELDYMQAQVIKDREGMVPKEIQSYIATFDNSLTDDELKSDRFAYRLLFSKVVAKRQGQADRVIEFIDPESQLAKNISKEYWVKEDREKPKFLRKDVLQKVHAAGYPDFGPSRHTELWKKHDGKNPAKGFGIEICGTWYWYQNWVDFILGELQKS